MTTLREEPAQLESLWDHIRHFPPDVADYKCRHLWGDVFEEFCRDVLGKNDPHIVNDEEKDGNAQRGGCPVGV